MEPPKKRLCLRLSVPHPGKETDEAKATRKSKHTSRPLAIENRQLPIRQWAVRPSVAKMVEGASSEDLARLVAKSWEQSSRVMLGIRFGEFVKAGITYTAMYARNFVDAMKMPMDMLCPKIDHKRCTEAERKECHTTERIVPVWIVPFFLEHIRLTHKMFRMMNNPVRIGFTILDDVGEAISDNNSFGVQQWHANLVREAVEVAASMTDESLEAFRDKATRNSQRFTELDLKYKDLKNELDLKYKDFKNELKLLEEKLENFLNSWRRHKEKQVSTETL